MVFRNKDVRYCPIGALALYLFWRFQVEDEPWPKFGHRMVWYSTKLLAKVNDPHDEMGAKAHAEACNKAYELAQCRFLKGTHTGRRTGCGLADMLDVPDAQMRRLGRWDHSRMTQHYSPGMPRQGARMLAGHGSEPGIFASSTSSLMIIGHYFLDRECLTPSEELQRMMFPLIEQSMIEMENMPEHLQDIASHSFLHLLRWLRIVLLQDAVFLQQQYPSLPLWLQAPFNHPLFKDFAARLQYESTHGSDPTFVQIAKTVPDIAHMIRDNFRNSSITTNIQHQSMNLQMQQIQIKLDESLSITQPLSTFLHHLSTDGLQMRTHVMLDNIMPSASSEQSTSRGIVSTSINTASTSIIHSTNANINAEVIPQYRLNPKVQTIVQLWEEYDQGIVSQPDMPRGPAIRILDAEHGSKWRQSDHHRKTYSRRRCIWEAISQASINLKISTEIVAEKMELWRRKNNYSLNRLNELLSKAMRDNGKENHGMWGLRDSELL